MSSKSSNVSKKVISNASELLNLSFMNSIRFKIIIVITLALLVGAPVSQYLNNILNNSGLIKGNVGSYINTLINLIVLNLIIVFFFNRMVITPLKKHLIVINEISLGNLSVTAKVFRNIEKLRCWR